MKYDALKHARKTAETINEYREMLLVGSVNRMIEDAPWLKRGDIIDGLPAFHKEALSKIPSYTEYPEAKEWVEGILDYEKELKRLANLNDTEVAIMMSMGSYMSFRGYKKIGQLCNGRGFGTVSCDEKCRCVFIPQTDRGPMHIKNVDDPATYWKPRPALPARAPIKESLWTGQKWLSDGVGNGLHIDDEPKEIFPLPIHEMVGECAEDGKGAVEFMKKYSQFWSGGNFMVFDEKQGIASIEKCSRNFCDVYPPDEYGSVHISGMVCRDPESPQGKYVKAKRKEYCNYFGIPDDGPDNLFWNVCFEVEKKLSEGVNAIMPKPKFEDVVKLFITPYPEGMCKTGAKFHPKQGLAGYTLLTHSYLFETNTMYRWQRDEKLNWPEKPEICKYE